MFWGLYTKGPKWNYPVLVDSVDSAEDSSQLSCAISFS